MKKAVLWAAGLMKKLLFAVATLLLLATPADTQQPLTANVLGQVQMPGQTVLGNSLPVPGGLTAIPFGSIVGAGAGAGAGAGVTSSVFTYQNSGFTAVSLTAYQLDSSSVPLTINLPATPVSGTWVRFLDVTSSWATNNVTVNGNGANINSVNSTLTLNIAGSDVLLTYVNPTIGWKGFTR